jgi:carbonic anhydrase
MLQLVKGVHHFEKEVFRNHQELFQQLASGQSPSVLFITCSDSRICPTMITQSKPGELFILRVAGNIIPPYDEVHGGEAATIEYAVKQLGVRDIIMCGHSFCGAMAAVVNPEGLAEKLPATARYLKHAEKTKKILDENYADVKDPATRLSLAVRENVLVQLENLRTHPCVAEGLQKGEISLYGWIYQFEAGLVKAYAPDLDKFVPMDQIVQQWEIQDEAQVASIS